MSKFKQYRRTNLAEMRPVTAQETASVLQAEGVSISKADLDKGSPMIGDMIARNPNNHNDQWLVAKQYFQENFDLIKD
jgi:hypothetical protein